MTSRNRSGVFLFCETISGARVWLFFPPDTFAVCGACCPHNCRLLKFRDDREFRELALAREGGGGRGVERNPSSAMVLFFLRCFPCRISWSCCIYIPGTLSCQLHVLSLVRKEVDVLSSASAALPDGFEHRANCEFSMDGKVSLTSSHA